MEKFGWDLPPGCSINDIPGNRPEDIALEDAEQKIVDELFDAKASICDYELIAVLIKPVVEIYQKEIAKVQKEDNANHAEYMDWLKCEIGGMLAEIENDERYKEKQSGFDQAHGEVVAYKRVLKLMGEKIDVD